MTPPEKPWMPGHADIPWAVALINPHGDRHGTA